MSKKITFEEEKIINEVLEAICIAPHNHRHQIFSQTYGKSVECGFTGWALMCRGFVLLLDERYEFFNDTLWEKLENHSFDGEAHGQDIAYYALRPLLFAQAHRRRADREMDNYKRNLYENKSELRKRIDYELEKSSELYKMIATKDRDERIMAVAWHGLAKLAYMAIRYRKTFEHNQELRFRFSDKLEKPERYYTKSVAIAEKAGFDYAPPMNAIAWLSWLKYQENFERWDQEQRVSHLQGCLNWLDRAIKASRQKYAPPLLLKAAIQHRMHIETGQSIDREETQKLISRAIHLSPYDSIVQSEIEAFSDALKGDVKHELISREFYRQVKFTQPTKATKASLNQYLIGDEQTDSTSHRNQLLVLRRWSSYTPLIKLRDHSTMGGGYLLEWEGTRIAIDPGVGFVRNLYEYGYRVQDLDAVLVTHQHIDHADDIEAILTILKTCADMGNSGTLQRLPKFLLTESGDERWTKMILSALDLKNPQQCVKILRPDPMKRTFFSVRGIEIFPVPLHNHQDALDKAHDLDNGGRPPTGCGLVFNLPKDGGGKYLIGITSDTGYLSTHIKNVGKPLRASEYYKDCDVVVLHLSTIDDLDERKILMNKENKFINYEYNWGENVGFPNLLYKKHLGFWGVALFIKDLVVDFNRSDRVIVLSEFGEEMLKNRVAVLNELCYVIESLGSQGIEQAKRIYIGDVGTQVRLPEGEIGCHFGLNRCQNLADRFLEFDDTFGDLSIPHRSWNDRAIVHFCRNHDFLVGNPLALNSAVWGYYGRPFIDNELREVRFRSTGEVHKCIGNYWI